MKCSNRNHRAIIKHFRQVAAKRSADFVLQPWQNKCTDYADEGRHFGMQVYKNSPIYVDYISTKIEQA
jgi:hypothetical protein